MSLSILSDLTLSNAGDGRSSSKKGQFRGRRATLVGAWMVMLLMLAARTLKRNQDWQDDEALYRSGVPVCPPKGEYNKNTRLLPPLPRKGLHTIWPTSLFEL